MITTVKDIDLDELRRQHLRLYYFGLGFIQLKIDEVSRLHFYAPQLPAITEEPHSHRYGFLSRVLRGRLTNRLYTLEAGDTHDVVDESCNPDTKAPPREQRVGLVEGPVRTYSAGESYVMTDEMFHRVEAEGGCITYLVRTHCTKEYAKVVRPVGIEPMCPFSVKVPEARLWEIMREMISG